MIKIKECYREIRCRNPISKFRFPFIAGCISAAEKEKKVKEGIKQIKICQAKKRISVK